MRADKHESLLQIGNMILMRIVKHWQGSQNSKLTMSLQYLRNKVKDELDFLHSDKHQSFLQVDFNTLAIKDAYKVILSILCWAWSSILKVLKVISLQNLYNILRKKLKKEFIFCMQMNINVSTSWNCYFCWKWSDMSKIPQTESW